MRTPIKTAVAVFGGATAVVLAVGFGVGGVSPAGNASTATIHSSSAVTATQPDTVTPVVHVATLAGCITGANC